MRKRVRTLTDRGVTTHQSHERVLVQLVAREHTAKRLGRLRIPFL